jgi:Uncharacterized protein conserved in bacteria
MKNKITTNLFLKILSVVVAFLFWLVIINVTDPTMAKTFRNIPVKILNENVITSANQVYEIESGDTVNVTVKGKRSFVEKLTSADFTATADLSELSKVNAVGIAVQLKKQSGSGVDVEWGNAVLKVNLEQRETKKFRVEVEHEGELSENYVLGNIVAQPNIVEVSCGESKFKKIDHVGVMVSLNGESEDFEKRYKPILYNEDGEVIDSSNVTFSNDTIKVSTQVLATKEIPLYVEAKGKPASGYRLVGTDFRPETIQVYGSKDVLGKTISIKIPVSVAGAKKDVEREIRLDRYLPAGLSTVSDMTTVSVRCQIEKNGSRSFVMTPSDVAVKNLPSNYTMEFEDESIKYSVVVTGKEEDLSDLVLNDLGAYVDLRGLSLGIHTLEVRYNLPDGVKLKNGARVRVILRNQTSASETPPPATLIPSAPPEE